MIIFKLLIVILLVFVGVAISNKIKNGSQYIWGYIVGSFVVLILDIIDKCVTINF